MDDETDHMPRGGTPRAVRVMATVEVLCCRCGETARFFGVAEVLPDGRIGSADPPDDWVWCKACQLDSRADERRAVNAQNRAAKKRQAWAEGRPNLAK